MAKHIDLGAAGEAMAARELLKLGYRLIDTNVRMKMGELDIVAEEGGEMVVVEVRTRTLGRMVPLKLPSALRRYGSWSGPGEPTWNPSDGKARGG